MAEHPAPVPLADRLALVFGAGNVGPALLALAEVEAEILASARRGIDHGVAHARLEWWRGEIGRLAAGEPRHPAACRLLAAGGRAPDYALLGEFVANAEMTVVGYAPEGEPELLAHLDRGHGTRETVRAQLLSGSRDAELGPWARALGRGLGLVAALATHDAAVLEAVRAERLAALAREALATALALPASAQPHQVHGLVRARLALATLERAGAEPSALRQWWLAWRTARRARGSVP